MAMTAVRFLLLALTVVYVCSARTPTRRGRAFPNVLGEMKAPHRRNNEDTAQKYKNGFLSFDRRKKASSNLKELQKSKKRRGFTCEKDGVIYEPFEKVPVPGCEQECYCPEFGGTIRCKALHCPAPLCIDPEETPGSCCPSCVNGENCKLGDEMIQGYGLDIILPYGNCDQTCRCPGEEAYAEQGKNTLAVCVPLC